MKKKLQINFEWLPQYKHLFLLILEIINHKKPSINEFYELGGRGGAKTELTFYLAILSILMALTHPLWKNSETRIITRIFRKYSESLKETMLNLEMILNKHESLHSLFKMHYVKKQIQIGRHYICFHYLNTRDGKVKKKALTGLASFSDVEYNINIADESYEFTIEDMNLMTQAVRGAKHIIWIWVSNPWRKDMPFIEYCDKMVPFEKETLINFGDQHRIIKANNIIKSFHYSNYQWNPFLGQDWVNKNITELKDKSYSEYLTAGIGIPGILTRGIFTNSIKYVKNYYQEIISEDNIIKYLPAFTIDKWCIGFDYGNRIDSAVGYIAGFDYDLTKVAILGEFYLDNSINHNLDHIGINAMFLKWIEEVFIPNLRICPGTVKIYTDNDGSLAQINNWLKDMREKDRLYNYFESCYKAKTTAKNNQIKPRTAQLCTIMNNGNLFIDKEECPYLIKSWESAEWEEDKNLKKLIRIVKRLGDNCLDASEYALLPYMFDIINNNDITHLIKNIEMKWQYEKNE